MLYPNNNCLPFHPNLGDITGEQLPCLAAGYQYSSSEFNLPTTSLNVNNANNGLLNNSVNSNYTTWNPSVISTFPSIQSPPTNNSAFTLQFAGIGQVNNSFERNEDYLFPNKENAPNNTLFTNTTVDAPKRQRALSDISSSYNSYNIGNVNGENRKFPLQPLNINHSELLNEPRTARVHDEKYWERRLKNNEAAKQSRSKRKDRENQLRQQVAELESENRRLRKELNELIAKTSKK